MRDPRTADQQSTGVGAIQPWLAVSGNYDTYLDQPGGTLGSSRRSVSLGGGLSAVKSFQRTALIFSYAGSGTDYTSPWAGAQQGWMSSNVINLAVSSQVSRRLTLDFAETGGAANGGFGSAAAAFQSGGMGMLGSLGAVGGYMSGAGAGLGGMSGGLDVLQNGLVDSDYFNQMTYFSSTSANAGFLLSPRTMVNVGGSAAFIRRAGRSFSDINMVGANAMISTQLSQRLSTFFGYSFSRIDFVQSIGNTDIQGGFAGISYLFSQRDQFSLSVSDSYMNSTFLSTVALPPDIAAVLGVSTTSVVRNNSRSYPGGRLSYRHEFQRGGFGLLCDSMIAPGNDLILMARTQGCSVTLSRELTPRFSVSGVGGLRRLTGMTQSGGRYDVMDGGLIFSYRVLREVSLFAGADYFASQIHPSSNSLTGVEANGGLRWSPRNEGSLF